MIDGATSMPFSANTLPPIKQGISHKKDAIISSKKKYSKMREEVEKNIYARFGVEILNEQKRLFI